MRKDYDGASRGPFPSGVFYYCACLSWAAPMKIPLEHQIGGMSSFLADSLGLLGIEAIAKDHLVLVVP